MNQLSFIILLKTRRENNACQILAYNDTSFLLNGELDQSKDIYGWGRNENTLLCSSKEYISTPKKIKLTKGNDIGWIDIQFGHFIAYKMIEEDSYSSDEGSSDDLEEERADKVKKLDEDISNQNY